MCASLSTGLFLLFFLPSLLIATTSQPTCERCNKDSNYTVSSTFQANLNSLLSSLSAATPATGFANLTKGQYPDQVYGLAQCRGDTTTDECRNCTDNAVQAIVQRCPTGKASFVWYDSCFLRYSNRNFFTIADTSYRCWAFNLENSTEPDQLMDLVKNMMDGLTTRAAYGSSSGRKFATGEANFQTFTKLYSMVQCTRDLSPDDCNDCLRTFTNYIQDSYGRKGLLIIGQTCFLRYQVSPFYNVSGVGSAPPPPGTTTPVAAPPPMPVSVVPPSTSEEDKNKATDLILITVIPVVAALLFFSAICIWLRKRKIVERTLEICKKLLVFLDVRDEEEIRGAESLLFDLATLRAATSHFSDANKLGEGGFGPVYKGILLNGQEIAVKRLSRSSGQGLIELKNEVLFVARLQHRNLVRLLGFCLQGKEMLLVYEYLPNTSLDKFLFDPVKCQQLDWERRYNIIEGIGRGLLYLHEESRLKIIHRDMKASNILLDQDMNPKIADFGLAKLFGGDQSHAHTNQIAGTYGYMAPEYAMFGQFSTKSDVYSFGVVVLEIVTGRRNSRFQRSGQALNLPSYVWQHWNGGRALQLADHILGKQCQRHEVLRCLHIGLLCVQEDALSRPSMSSVVLMLSSFSVTLPKPSVPAFHVTSLEGLQREGGDVDSSESEYSIQNSNHSRPLSVYSVTLTEAAPR